MIGTMLAIAGVVMILLLVFIGDIYLKPEDPVKKAKKKIQAEKRQTAKKEQQVDRRAMNADILLTDRHGEYIGSVMGYYSEGDYPHVDAKQQVYIPKYDTNRHIIVIGSTGTGKTETLLRLAICYRALGMKIFFIDGKGDPKTQQRFTALMQSTGIPNTRILNFPEEPINIFHANPKDQYFRFMSMPKWAQEGDVYRQNASAIMLGIFSEECAPRSLDEFLQIIESPESVRKRAEENYDLYEALATLSDKDIQNACATFKELFKKAQNDVDGERSYEDIEVGYFRLDPTNKEWSQPIARYLLTDFADFLHPQKGRNKDQRKVALIFDEFTSVDAVELHGIIEQSRGFGGHVVLSTVDNPNTQHIKEDTIRRAIDGAIVTIAHGVKQNAELITNISGTMLVPEFTRHFNEGEDTGQTSSKDQHQKKISDNALRELTSSNKVGWAYIISENTNAKMKIARVSFGSNQTETLYMEKAKSLIDETRIKWEEIHRLKRVERIRKHKERQEIIKKESAPKPKIDLKQMGENIPDILEDNEKTKQIRRNYRQQKEDNDRLRHNGEITKNEATRRNEALKKERDAKLHQQPITPTRVTPPKLPEMKDNPFA